MSDLPDHAPDCDLCATRDGVGCTIPMTMAFQPILDLQSETIFAHEALVRPPGGGSAWDVLSQITPANRYSFDQRCRKVAIRLACDLGIEARLSINFMPNAVYEPRHCLRATIWAANRYGLPVDRIIFEFTENEKIGDVGHVRRVVSTYAELGFATAIDDFGAGHAGLGLLCDAQPQFVKLDMHLLRGIDTDRRRQIVLGAQVEMLNQLGITIVAEGIETVEELAVMRDFGLRYVQGYLLGPPLLEELETINRIMDRIAPRRVRKAG